MAEPTEGAALTGVYGEVSRERVARFRTALETQIASALSSWDAEIREVLEGLRTCMLDESDGPQSHWCDIGASPGGRCGPACRKAAALYGQLQAKEVSDVTE